MAYNEVEQEVPGSVEEAARQYSCLGGTLYVYQDGEYGGRLPVASIGCRRATRFRGRNWEKYKVAIGLGWVAFRSPSFNPVIPSADGPLFTRERFDETLDSLLRLTDPEAYSPRDDSWIEQAISDVDKAIVLLTDEFARLPFLHRVEHSLHVRLCTLLIAGPNSSLSGHFQIGQNLGVTQLVHKEWPETFARPEKDGRRGNFDVVVLSLRLLAACATVEDFREGRLAAPFVIEMGLDYDIHHLARDARKLINSRPHRGYLVHLTRAMPRDPDVEQIVLNLERETGIRTAYVCINGESVVQKQLHATALVEELQSERIE